MKKFKRGGIEFIKSKYGYFFVAPWVLGIVLFVLVPLFKCLLFSFSDVSMTPEGLTTVFTGIKNYKQIFVEDAYYVDYIASSLKGIFTSLPLVVALSMILAIILNQKFKGRLLARAVFFLPVIIASGAVMSVLSTHSMQQNLTSVSGAAANAAQQTEYMQAIDFTKILEKIHLPSTINDLLATYLSNTFNLIWSCGVQILLFVAGLQQIPTHLYEVGKVEGITAWEEFWFVTVPLMGRVILLVIFYTMVELFVSKSPLVSVAIEKIAEQDYSIGSAMIWPYFLLVGIIIGIVLLIYNTLCLRKWE